MKNLLSVKKESMSTTLKCEVFRYEDETVDTGVAEIDDETGDNADGTSQDGLSTLLGSSQTSLTS